MTKKLSSDNIFDLRINEKEGTESELAQSSSHTKFNIKINKIRSK